MTGVGAGCGDGGAWDGGRSGDVGYFFAAPKDSLVGIVGSVYIFSARFGMVELL